MAYPGKKIMNPLTGQEIRFLQTAASTNGSLLEIESTYKPGSVEPPMHYHPAQTEHFTILDGEMTVTMNGSTRVLKTGETLVVHPGTHHAMWNHGNRPATINWRVRPALNMEHFFETLVGLSADGKTKPNGMPASCRFPCSCGVTAELSVWLSRHIRYNEWFLPSWHRSHGCGVSSLLTVNTWISATNFLTIISLHYPTLKG